MRPFRTWPDRWNYFRSVLEAHAPCTYIPQYDYAYSCVSSMLSRDVIVAGTVQSDDPLHYEHVHRLGRYWNAIVAVSDHIRDRVVAANAEVAERVHVIPNCIPVPSMPRRRCRATDRPIRLIYAGRLQQYQKRVLDLPEIMRALQRCDMRATLTICGSGDDEAQLKHRSLDLVACGAVTFTGIVGPRQLDELYRSHDIVVLPAEFEGMPLCLLEAMACGCVPIVCDIPSGVRQLVIDGDNGYRVSVGDTAAFADRIAALYHDRMALQVMGERAHAMVNEGYHTDLMIDAYQRVFAQAEGDLAAGRYARPAGDSIRPSPCLRPIRAQRVLEMWLVKLFLGTRYGRRILRYARSSSKMVRRGIRPLVLAIPDRLRRRIKLMLRPSCNPDDWIVPI